MKNFKKIVLTIMLGILVLLPSAVYAKTEVKSEEELKSAVKTDGEIVLQTDITLKSALEIKGSNVIIDLNGKTITVDENGYFDLFEGKLEFTGTGKIKDIRVREITSTIWVEGSNDKTAKDFSTLTIGENVTIETTHWGVTIWGNPKGYGATVNFNGKINATGDGGAITITGNLKNDGKLENAPIINIGKTAKVIAEKGITLYGAGIGEWNILGGEYTGESVIGIKSGKLVVNDGVFTATGEKKIGELYGNGMIATGSTIQIENNTEYAGNMEIVINGGTFNSNKGLSIYHYPPTDNQENALKSLVINGGNFNAKFELLDNDNVTIEYGKFANEISRYLKNGYIQSKTDEVYSVSNIIGSGAGLLINGKVNTDYVKPGEEVTISTMGSYELDSVEVVTSDKKITVEDNKFVMPNKLVRVNAKTTQLYDILFEPNENVEMTFTTDGKEVESVKAGAEVKFNYTPKAGYIVKKISLVNLDTNKEIEVKDNTFTMPGASVQMKVTLEKVANIIETSKPIEVAGGVDKTVAEDLSKVKVDNSKTGLAESVDVSKLEDVTENDNIEVTIKTSLTSYDKEKNVLVYDIKPYYSVNGTEKGIISNDALTKAVKIELPVPSNVTDTHVKVTHKSGDKVIDTKSYEIKTRGEDKYIVLETNSFSTFELSFYTPASVENPKTGDNIMAYVITLAGSVLIIGGAVVVLKKRFNH